MRGRPRTTQDRSNLDVFVHISPISFPHQDRPPLHRRRDRYLFPGRQVPQSRLADVIPSPS